MSSEKPNDENAARENERLRERVALLEAQLEALLEASEGLAWVKDEDSRFVVANEAVGELAALPKDKIRGLLDSDIWERANAEAVRRDDVEVMRSERPKFVEEALDQRREGRTVWLSTRKVPVFLNGEAVGADTTQVKLPNEAAGRLAARGPRVMQGVSETVSAADPARHRRGSPARDRGC